MCQTWAIQSDPLVQRVGVFDASETPSSLREFGAFGRPFGQSGGVFVLHPSDVV